MLNHFCTLRQKKKNQYLRFVIRLEQFISPDFVRHKYITSAVQKIYFLQIFALTISFSSNILEPFTCLRSIATLVFNVRLLHAFTFPKKLLWLDQTNVNTLKTHTQGVNARRKWVCQLGFNGRLLHASVYIVKFLKSIIGSPYLLRAFVLSAETQKKSSYVFLYFNIPRKSML